MRAAARVESRLHRRRSRDAAQRTRADDHERPAVVRGGSTGKATRAGDRFLTVLGAPAEAAGPSAMRLTRPAREQRCGPLNSRTTMARRRLDAMTEPPDHGARRAQRGATTTVRAEEF